MTKNDELSGLLEGSMITATIREEDTVEIGFEDGTWLAVKTHPDSTTEATPLGAVVEEVRQGAGELEFKLQGGDSLQIDTASTGQPAVTVLATT